MAAWPSAAARAGVNLRTHLTDDITSSQVTDKENGNVTSTDTNRFDQLYNFDIARQLYPNLTVRGGVVYQFSDVRNKSEGVTTLNGRDMRRPFLDLNLATPIYSTGGGYERTQIRETGTGRITTERTQDQLHGRFLWEPVDFPRLNLNYTTTHRYDDASTIDQELDELVLNLRYDWQDFLTNYSYLQENSENLISGLQVWREVHDGRINFSRQLNPDLNLNCGYRASYATEVWEGVGQSFLAPLLRVAKGFYLLEDLNPLKLDDLGDGAFLVDGIKSGSSPINLGSGGDQDKEVILGLDFTFVTKISTIRVWLDSDASEPAGAFVWTVYTSEDNQAWEMHALTPFQVTYSGGIGSDNNYFELTLANSVAAPLSARYIRVAASPLSVALDPAGRFRDLYVNEVEAFSLEEGDLIRRSFGNSIEMGLLWRLDPQTTMGYGMFYRSRRTDAESLRHRTTAMSQTVNLNRTINRIFSGSIRGSREERQTAAEEGLSYSQGAVLAAVWLDTFRQSLSYSGYITETVHTFGPEGRFKETNKSNSVLLRNVARLYRGWSANVDFGYSWNIPWDAGTRYTKMFRVGSSIIPNPKFTVDASYTYSHVNSDLPVTEDQRAELSVAFSPTTVISLFSRVTAIDQSNRSKVYQEYSINWSPLPDGTVQLFLSYHENLTSDGDEITSSQAGVDWRVNSQTTVRTSFTKVKAESLTTIIDSQVISLRLLVSL